MNKTINSLTILSLNIVFNLVLFVNTINTLKAQTSTHMERTIIETQIGQIAVFLSKSDSPKTPIVFLHGVYFDHHLWENQVNSIHDRMVIAIDMPMHGESKSFIKSDWNLEDCANMLLEILDTLKIKKVIAIGHSWGSMTIIRAAHKNPNSFLALGLCNMPFKQPTKKEISNIKLQHSAMIFKKLYMNEAAKSLMSKKSIAKNPDLVNKLITSMSKLTNKEIKYTDKAVRMNAKDASILINSITIPMIALIGEEDYVGIPPKIETTIIPGGHVSPIEEPSYVIELINKLIKFDK